MDKIGNLYRATKAIIWEHFLLILLIVLTIIGFYYSYQLYSTNPFWSNYAANLAVTSSGFIIAIFVIEYIIKRKDDYIWRGVEFNIKFNIMKLKDEIFALTAYHLRIPDEVLFNKDLEKYLTIYNPKLRDIIEENLPLTNSETLFLIINEIIERKMLFEEVFLLADKRRQPERTYYLIEIKNTLKRLEEIIKIVEDPENTQKDKESFLVDYYGELILELVDNLYELDQFSGLINRKIM